jgi:hypothetical protein
MDGDDSECFTFENSNVRKHMRVKIRKNTTGSCGGCDMATTN